MKKVITLAIMICLLFAVAFADEAESLFRSLALMDASGGEELVAQRAAILSGADIKKTGDHYTGEIKLNGAAYKIDISESDAITIKLKSANPATKFATAAKPVNPFFTVMSEIFGDPALDRYVGGFGSEGGDTLSSPRTKKGLIDLAKVAKEEKLLNLSWQNTERKTVATIFGSKIGDGSSMELFIVPGMYTGRPIKEETAINEEAPVSDDPLQKLQIAGKPAPCEFGINADEVIAFYKPLKVTLSASSERILPWGAMTNDSGRTGIIVSESFGKRSFQYDGTYLEKTEFLCYSPTGIMKNGRSYENKDVEMYGIRMTVPAKSALKVFKAAKKEFVAKYGTPDEESTVVKSTMSINGYSKSSTFYPHVYKWQIADGIGIRIDADTDSKGNPLKRPFSITVMRTGIDNKLKK